VTLHSMPVASLAVGAIPDSYYLSSVSDPLQAVSGRA